VPETKVEKAIKTFREILERFPCWYQEEEDLRNILYLELRKEYEEMEEPTQGIGLVHCEMGWFKEKERYDIIIFDKNSLEEAINKREISQDWIIIRERKRRPPSLRISCAIEITQGYSTREGKITEDEKKKILRALERLKKLEQQATELHLIYVHRTYPQQTQRLKAELGEFAKSLDLGRVTFHPIFLEIIQR